MNRVETIMTAAMTLDHSERLALADALYEGLSSELEDGVSAEWSREIRRRLGELDNDTVSAIGGDQLLATLDRIVSGDAP